MSVHLLTVEPRDVDAGALGLLVDAPAPTALVELCLTDPGAGRLVLGVLGASHVVSAASRGRELTEQVSCDAVDSGGRPLPEFEERDGYRFTSRIESVPIREFRDRAHRLRDRSLGAGWLCAAFPGDRDALTALWAESDGHRWRWRTWHLYPREETGVIVETQSRWNP